MPLFRDGAQPWLLQAPRTQQQAYTKNLEDAEFLGNRVAVGDLTEEELAIALEILNWSTDVFTNTYNITRYPDYNYTSVPITKDWAKKACKLIKNSSLFVLNFVSINVMRWGEDPAYMMFELYRKR